MKMMKLFGLIILSASLLLLPMTTGAEETESESTTVAAASRKGTPTKTVYGFLDFTTTVSDTVMIFKPSKSPGQNKGRSIVGGSRTASVLLSKPAKLHESRVAKDKISSSPPTIEASAIESDSTAPTTEDDLEVLDEESTGRSGTLRGLRPRPSSGQVEIEGSLVVLDESPSFNSAKSKIGLTERLNKPARRSRLSSASVEVKGTGSVVSMFPLMHSQVDVSSRVDIRIGGAKVSNGVNKLVPKQVEVRTEMKLAQEDENQQQEKRRKEPMLPGQSLVSKSVGTRIQNGMTTIHETSIIGTTIDGQYAHFVQSTSRIFQEPSISVKPSAFAGTVEVVTELPSVGHSVAGAKKPVTNQQKSTTKSSTTTTTPTPVESTTTEEGQDVDLASLPSLESLFGSVNANSGQRAPEQLSGRKKPSPDDEDKSPAVLLKPSFRVTPAPQAKSTTEAPSVATTSGNIERRAGLASPPRLRDNAGSNNTPRPIDQRWRYNPSPKPKVAIHRGSASGTGSRFRDRAPATTSAPLVRDEDDPYDSYDESYQEAPPQQQQQQDTGDIDPTEIITLRVQTTTPVGYTNFYYEVATIKSPYIMRLGAVRNTRYVTLTRTFTKLVASTPAPSINTDHLDQYQDQLRHQDEEREEVLLDPSRPLPDPENILATTAPYENILKDSSDTATLPAIIVAATESGDLSFDLQTVTETFSTTELAMKTSILPYLRGGTTSHMTLTQSYYITRVVVAVKTVPPPDLYQFIPSKTLTDISTNLQEAGSEHINDRLLPGELEFSENDEYDEDDGHRNEKRVPPPNDFLSQTDLSSIGQDFDLTSMDKSSPFHQQVNLEPSLVDAAAEPSSSKQGTPPLPSGNFQLEPSISSFGNNNNGGGHSPFGYQGQGGETPMLSPEQLQQLALFRYMNPYAAAGLPFGFPGMGGFPGAGNAGVQVIQTSRPVVKTIDVIRTETVPIWDGAKTFYSTVTRTRGTTVVTETEYGTTTVAANPLNQLFPQQFTVVSTPVVTEITTTSTELRIYRIIFRAQTTYTTVTSTSVFPTIVTTYVSNTIPIQPTAYPQGIFPGSFGGYPNFG